MSDTPDGLHPMQLACHILEEILAWPAKGNAELMCDCLISLTKAKRLTPRQAHDYMVRAIGLAREQGVKLDAHWFRNGEYTHMRPVVERYEQPESPAWVRELADKRREEQIARCAILSANADQSRRPGQPAGNMEDSGGCAESVPGSNRPADREIDG